MSLCGYCKPDDCCRWFSLCVCVCVCFVLQKIIHSFAFDAQHHVLILSYHGDGISMSLNLKSEGEIRQSDSLFRLAFVRQSDCLKADLPLERQIRVCQLNGSSPLEDLLAFVRFCFYPYSKSVLSTLQQQRQGKDRSSELFRSVNGKLGELEVELLRSQLNVEVPQVKLEVMNEIEEYVSKVISDSIESASIHHFPILTRFVCIVCRKTH